VTAASPLEKLADAHGLAHSKTVSLPQQGNLLTRGGRIEGAVKGRLPGGIEGTLAHYTYTYTTTDSDNHTETHHRFFTVVVTAIPESIGFMPSLGFAGAGSEMSGVGGSLEEVVKVDLGGDKGLEGARCYRYKGASENWTQQLFSPALIDWLARSESDFGFELANGVLCVSRKSYLEDTAAMTTLCEEAAQLAGAIRTESEEEVDSGDGQAAKDPNASDARVEAALREVEIEPPATVIAADAEFRSHVARSARTLWRSLGYSLALALILNIPGVALPIVMIVNGAYLPLAIIEVALVAIIFFFVFRKEVRQTSQKAATEAFYRGYAASRGMALEEPLHFAATHVEAKLPFRPDRVLSGALPGGGEGCLCILGDGGKRSDRVAVVAGPAGPLAESELEAEPQGLSTKDLDTYLEQLAGEAREDAATAPASETRA
jgi:hypothetical protein